MAVAPSFRNFQFIGTPFQENGKQYINVKNPKTSHVRKVRWYEDSDLPTKYKIPEVAEDKSFPMLKHARGFDAGPILVIRGLKTPEDEMWCRASIARFAVGIGWYIISTDTLPENAPPHFKYLLLGWDEFRKGDDFHMKSPVEVAMILSNKEKKGEWIKF